MRYITRVLPVMILAAALFTGCSYNSGPSRARVKDEKDRRLAPDFSLKDAHGQTVKLSDYRGKVVVLNFWATWCGPCQIEIPWFESFEQNYKSRDFAVLGISMDDDGWASVKPYIERKKINYRIMVANDAMNHEYGAVSSLPTTFILDREGRIASVHIGLPSKSDYETEILKLLENSKDGEPTHVSQAIPPR
jgi:peroxiredoxin